MYFTWREKMSEEIDIYDEAFEIFMEEAFEDACISSTKASWGGSGYSVELFADGTYRVLWNNNIGNLYDSPGLIISIPPLGDEEWDDDIDICYFDRAIEAMKDIYAQAKEDLKTYKKEREEMEKEMEQYE